MDDEVKALIEKAYNHCAEILKNNQQKLQQIVDFLMEHEVMSGTQFRQCMEGVEITEDSGSLFDGFDAE